MTDEDAVFWDRLADMPAWEAEQECVARREALVLRQAMLAAERAKINPPIGQRQKDEFAALGVAVTEDNAQLTRLNERIKYLRNLQAKVQWKDAVRTLFGADAMEQCIVWLEQQYGEQQATRRAWARG